MTIEELYKWAKENGIENNSLYLNYYCADNFYDYTGKITAEMLKIDSGRPLIEISDYF